MERKKKNIKANSNYSKLEKKLIWDSWRCDKIIESGDRLTLTVGLTLIWLT